MRTWTRSSTLVVVVIAGALAPRAQAQQAQQSSDAFDRACIDLLHGKPPKGEQAANALRDACASLMKARTDERIKAEKMRQAQAQAKAQAKVEPGRSAAQPQAGGDVPTAFAQAGEELITTPQHGAMGMGMKRSGEPTGNTLVTNPVGWFTGMGVNAELLHSFQPEFSWLGGLFYAQTQTQNQSVYTLGATAGADWFAIGRNNEGLRLGPRATFSFGRETPGSDATSSRLAVTGEVGYNFIASNGITGEAAFGLGGRVSGDKNNQLSAAIGGEFGPYVKLGLGYSW
jgi:hypothetical protein